MFSDFLFLKKCSLDDLILEISFRIWKPLYYERSEYLPVSKLHFIYINHYLRNGQSPALSLLPAHELWGLFFLDSKYASSSNQLYAAFSKSLLNFSLSFWTPLLYLALIFFHKQKYCWLKISIIVMEPDPLSLQAASWSKLQSTVLQADCLQWSLILSFSFL